jgi:hypothetical protein
MAEWVKCEGTFDGLQKATQEALGHTVFCLSPAKRDE